MSASNSRRQYAFIKEVTFGTTPATPQTQLIEVVDFTGDMAAEELIGTGINANRQVNFARRGNTSVEGNLEIELCPDNFDWALEAVFGGTFTAGNVLKVGNTVSSYAIEEGFTDIGQYRTFNGVVFNTLSMSVTPDSLVRASFGFMGASVSAFSGTSIDTTPTAITPKDVFFHDGGSVLEGGTAVANITAIDFEMTNNITGNYALGSGAYRSMTLGKVSVTGTVTALFESVALYNKFKDNTDSSLRLNLVAGAESLAFRFPKVKYTKGSIKRGGDGPVLVELGFTGVYDTTDATSFMITRA